MTGGPLSNHESAIREGPAPHPGGEQVLAAIVASPRGSQTAQTGGAAGMIDRSSGVVRWAPRA